MTIGQFEALKSRHRWLESFIFLQAGRLGMRGLAPFLSMIRAMQVVPIRPERHLSERSRVSAVPGTESVEYAIMYRLVTEREDRLEPCGDQSVGEAIKRFLSEAAPGSIIIERIVVQVLFLEATQGGPRPREVRYSFYEFPAVPLFRWPPRLKTTLGL